MLCDRRMGDGGCTSPNETVGMMGMAARKEVDLAIGCSQSIIFFKFPYNLQIFH